HAPRRADCRHGFQGLAGEDARPLPAARTAPRSGCPFVSPIARSITQNFSHTSEYPLPGYGFRVSPKPASVKDFGQGKRSFEFIVRATRRVMETVPGNLPCRLPLN